MRLPSFVPTMDLSRLARCVRDRALSEWSACLDECDFVGGPRVSALERQLEAKLAVNHAVACANGTDALVVALQAMGVGPGSKVALPNLTFWATFEAVVQVGATPVLVDIDPDDLQLSLDELRAAHDAHRFDFAILVHLYGWASWRLPEIRSFCRERGIALLEDAAQAFGVEVGGRPVLEGAEVATMSFYPAKVIGGAMDGGAVLARSPKLADSVRSLCNHGREGHYTHSRVGWNSRMSALQAAYLSKVVDLSVDIVRARRIAARRYFEMLFREPSINVYGPPLGIAENGYLNVITVDGKLGDDVVAKLKAAGIGAGRTYPIPLCSQPAAMTVDALAQGDLMASRAFCGRVVNLPLFFGITEEEQGAAIAALLGVIR